MTAPAQPSSRPVRGVLWMLLSGLCFVGVNAIVRHLGTALPAAQSAFLRFAWGALFLAPTLGPLLRRGLPQGTAGLFAGRGAVHAAAVIFWFYAMARLPIAEVTAIGYLNPVLVTIGGVLFFGERLAFRRILAVLLALAGALVILRPGLRDVSLGQLAQLCAATGFAGSYLFAKRLSQLAPAGLVVAMMSLAVTLFLMPLALAVWVPVSLPQLLWLGLTAAFATAAHYAMTRAFREAPLAVTQPVTFLQLVWATLLGTMVFGEPVDPWVLAGGAIIIAAVSYIAWRETVLAKRPPRPLADATKLQKV